MADIVIKNSEENLQYILNKPQENDTSGTRVGDMEKLYSSLSQRVTKIEQKDSVEVVDNLTTEDSKKALSAKQGKILSDKIGDITTLKTTEKSNVVKAINEVKDSIGSGGSTTEVVDNLISTDTDKALSAKQGKILNDNLTTLENTVNNIPSADVSPTFSSYSTGSTYSGTEGLCKFSFKGITAKVMADSPSEGYVRAYYYMASGMVGKKPDLPNTNSTVMINNKEAFSLGNMNGLSGTYSVAGTKYTFEDVYDEYTDSYFVQRISGDFYPKEDYITEDLVQTGIKGANGALFELRIPEKAFGDNLPYKNAPTEYKPFVCPMARSVSEDHLLNKATSYNNYYGQYISFAWHEPNAEGATDIEKSGYYSIHFASQTDGSSKALLIKKLFYSKWFIRYSLAEPIYKYNTGKLYIHKNDIITIQDSETAYTATVDYIQTPDNIKSQITGLDSVTTNLIDLNQRVENVEITESDFGYSDGTTDNYDYIVSLLDDNKNSGVNKVISIPAGNYYVSKPIVLSNSHTSIEGKGEVIIKCPQGAPAFVISNNFVSIDGITFWISKTEDSASAEEDNGKHSAIYIDGGKGIYNTKITNCDFQGAYRLSTKDIERSYGVYIPEYNNSIYTSSQYGYSYFNIIDNCRFYALYCGIYLGEGAQPSKVWFSFDRGENIYNIPNLTGTPCYNTLGCGYGCICNGYTNTIRFDGQFIGEDHTNPTNPVFETIDGVKTCTSATVNNLSVCAVKCGGRLNYIEGFAYDVQRCDKGYIWFTKDGRNNIYSLLNYGSTYGFADSMVFWDEYDVYDTDNTKYTVRLKRNHRYILDECGLNRSAFCPPRLQNDEFLSSDSIAAVSTDGNLRYNVYTKHFGVQDNALAYLTKWGGYGSNPAVRAYRLNEQDEKVEVTIFQDNPSDTTATTYDSLFEPVSKVGFDKGVTFEKPPSQDNPIYMEIIFGKSIKIERLVLKFNNYIAKKLSIYPIANNDPTQYDNNNGIGFDDNNKGQIDFSLYHDTHGWGSWDNVTGLRIVITEGFKSGTYNTSGYVGFSNIFALASNFGGKSYLPSGGGEVYGDIKMKSSKLFLGLVDELPVASEANRGSTIILKGDASDKIYVCLKTEGTYNWVSLN